MGTHVVGRRHESAGRFGCARLEHGKSKRCERNRKVAEDHLGPKTVLFLGTYDEGDRYVGYVAAAVGRYVVVVMMSDSYLGAADLTSLNGVASAAMSRARA